MPRWRPSRGQAFDAILAAVPMVLGLSQVWLGWSDGGVGGAVHGHQVVRSLLAVAATAPLAWRRRAPLPAVAVIDIALAVQVLFVVPHVSFLAGLVPLTVVTYSAAVYGPRRWRVVGLVAAFAVQGAFYARIAEERVHGEMVFAAFVLLGTWAVGDVVRTQWHRAEAVADRARLLVHEREAEAAAVLAEERNRIARELHDVIAHSVSVMGVQAGAARMYFDTDPEGAREALRGIEATARSSVGELQRLLAVLRDGDAPAGLEPQPGLGQLSALVDQVRVAGLVVALDIDGVHAQVPPGVDLAAYRVVQEALTNALKHSGAPTSVRVTFDRTHVDIEVCNDGAANRRSGSPGGHGLIGMRERVLLYGGTIEAGPGDQGGFTVHARLPLGAEVPS